MVMITALFQGELANNKDLLRSCLTDMQVIIKRLEASYDERLKEISSLSTEIENFNKEIKSDEQKEQTEKSSILLGRRSNISRIRYSLDEAIGKRDDRASKIELIQNSKFAIVLTPEVIELQPKVLEQYEKMHKRLALPLFIGDISGINIGDLSISFDLPSI